MEKELTAAVTTQEPMLADRLIVVQQLPVIKEQLHSIKAQAQASVAEALALVCTEETLKAVKDRRAALTRDRKDLDTSSQTERYIKATNLSNRIAGVHTDEYAMLIGGNKVEEGQDFLARNLPLFIPVSLAGRVHAKVVGPVHTGDYIVLSSTPGVGRAVGSCEAYPANKIVGYACEGDDRTDMRLIKVRVGGV